jgi:hypothetical protein
MAVGGTGGARSGGGGGADPNGPEASLGGGGAVGAGVSVGGGGGDGADGGSRVELGGVSAVGGWSADCGSTLTPVHSRKLAHFEQKMFVSALIVPHFVQRINQLPSGGR